MTRRPAHGAVRHTPTTLPPGASGWFGKVPARGDFVSQGLPAALVRSWDGWLQGALRRAGQQWPADMLDQRLLAFAPWRFLVWPDGVGDRPWAGVLVASHDRVGRPFPLMVAELLDPTGLPALDWLDIEAALARMADVALDATDTADPTMAEAFDAVLGSLGPVFAPSRVAARVAMRVATQTDGQRPRTQQSALDLLRNSPGTQSLWWSEPPPGSLPMPLGDSWPPHAELLLDILAASHDAR